jgi:hypothetical protein
MVSCSEHALWSPRAAIALQQASAQGTHTKGLKQDDLVTNTTHHSRADIGVQEWACLYHIELVLSKT